MTKKASSVLADPDSKDFYAAVATDLALIKTQIAVLTAKLDADAGVTDVNYGTLVNVPLVLQTSV